jgi:predicted nucleotide-binding protein
MRIAVLGSWRSDPTGREWELVHREHFRLACEELGQALAGCGHELLVAQAADETADKYVSHGFDRVGGRRTIMKSVRGARTWGALHIATVEQSEAVVIIGGAGGSHSAGMAALLAKKPLIPVGFFGGAARELLRDLAEPIPGAIANTLNELDPSRDANWIYILTHTVTELLEAFPKILIIHGRSGHRFTVKKILEDARTEFQNLPGPVIMSEHGLDANTIPELFEALAANVDAAIAVVTPDDVGATAIDAQGQPIRAIDIGELVPRARENVWIEVGWFWGRLGRNRIMILRQGERVTIPSDLGSVMRHTYTTDASECRDEILDFVRKLRTGVRHPLNPTTTGG